MKINNQQLTDMLMSYCPVGDPVNIHCQDTANNGLGHNKVIYNAHGRIQHVNSFHGVHAGQPKN